MKDSSKRLGDNADECENEGSRILDGYLWRENDLGAEVSDKIVIMLCVLCNAAGNRVKRPSPLRGQADHTRRGVPEETMFQILRVPPRPPRELFRRYATVVHAPTSSRYARCVQWSEVEVVYAGPNQRESFIIQQYNPR